eukprot:gene5153-8759_t
MTLCDECVPKKQKRFEEKDCPKCKINEIVVGEICRYCSYKLHICSVCQQPLPIDTVEIFQWKAIIALTILIIIVISLLIYNLYSIFQTMDLKGKKILN